MKMTFFRGCLIAMLTLTASGFAAGCGQSADTPPETSTAPAGNGAAPPIPDEARRQMEKARQQGAQVPPTQ